MTLILAAGNPDQVVQISDRLLVGSAGPRVLPRNKAVVLELSDARFACGYAGLAVAQGGFDTEDWLLTALSEAAPPDYLAAGTLSRFVDRATDLLTADARVSRLSPADRRVSFMFTGYVYGVDPPLLVGALVSNFQDYTSGADNDEAWDVFRPMWITEKRPGPTPVPTYVQRIGMWPAMSADDVDGMKALLADRRPHEAIVEKGLDVVRTVAARPAARRLVGTDLSSVTLFSDPARAEVAGYHPAAARHEWRGVSKVVALGDDRRLTIKDLVFRAVDPKPGTPAMTGPRVGRNARCPCGSGKKYKRCHGR